MNEIQGPSVLRCGQCNKPFDKQSTLKRHGYYCRSRRARTTTKLRSCSSCAGAKARCDNRRPECSRCITKVIKCHYPANTPKIAGPKFQHSDDASTELCKTTPSLAADSPSVENRQEASNDGDIFLDGAIAVSDSELANIGREYLDWGQPDIDLTELLTRQTHDEAVQSLASESSSLVRDSTDQTVHLQQDVSFRNVSIPTLPDYNTRSFIHRPKLETGERRTASLMLHTLKSYPLMMLDHNALPPFIHTSLITSDVENNCMEPLNNCISLLHMVNSGVQGSRKLFWRNVRQECERFGAVYLGFNKWELLAALQALSIYIIMRLEEGETDHNDFDFLLVTTVIIISKQINDITRNPKSALSSYGLEGGWKEWIFEESTRRLCVIYQVLNMLVYFEPAAMCDLHTDFILAPLPAEKQLWEAVDEFRWKAESEREPGAQTVFGLAADGELVKLDAGQIYCRDAVLVHEPLDARAPTRSTAKWEEWCSGMDRFGGLVMLAASLVV
ncbi:hypothetical protein BJ170DRAFT_692521 [Xylariales sp. AK1849]|nr:hypothetical protein BJ170DRAFT_692521 [Xylariales sp. AK1849]